jgi:Meiotically Up-regulated Gene 113 (MUG113) protein
VDWANERYVCLYTRDTPEWAALEWQARALFYELMRKVDRAGLLPLGKSGLRGLAGIVRIPLEIVEASLPLLLADGCVVQRGSTLVLPNFMPAQEATRSDKQRQRDSRERRRAEAMAAQPPPKPEGVIYYVADEAGGPVKIGFTQDLQNRLRVLQTGQHRKLILLASHPGTQVDEASIHLRFAGCRAKGEWFSPSSELMSHVASVTRRDTPSQDVTDCHVRSHAVTPGHTPSLLSDPIRSEPTPIRASREPAREGGSPSAETGERSAQTAPRNRSQPSPATSVPADAHEGQEGAVEAERTEEAKRLASLLGYAAAYSAGVASETKAGHVVTERHELDRFALVTTKHALVAGKALRGEALTAWLRDRGAAYVRATRHAAQFQRGYAPSKFLEWLSAGCPPAPSGTNGHGPHGRPVIAGPTYPRLR